MRYRRRRSARSRRLPLVIVLASLGVTFVGFICLILAMSLGQMLTQTGDSAVFFQLINDPLTDLYHGGLITFVGGWVCLIVGGIALIT